MDRLIYTAYTGLSASMIQQRVIANNMANAQTTGFRAELLVATPTTVKGTGLEARAMTDAQVRGANMQQGDLEQTGNPLDVALTGDSMLALQAGDGTEVYTRRGDLAVDANGTLVNGDGLPVLSETGPITVPAGTKLAINPDGTVLATDPALANAPAEAIGRLKLASTTGSVVEKGLDGLFRVVGGGVLPGDDAARLVSGSLEKSNVNATQVLVDMVSSQRLFEMRAKVVASAKDNDEKSTELMSLPT
ncbi:flagellar basal body rod protein FlgF [Novosphingobium sp. FSW06-99]|uniref:flagellar basal body rod protein FlgF n=1 Tax=Novosphingobium sp. FSW06-99 TaxID=1739113 RepID=UPI00076C1335|nr:flagellar basal body rod protein FlgF [Novosphingobium sp. FSW06-99]KUR71928.1 flagellar biosynthesis protein FlgF [Novosphingobium sp. FSW06-99]